MKVIQTNIYIWRLLKYVSTNMCEVTIHIKIKIL